jgi:glyoxylate/hydroxypyruvate reductase A
MGAGVDDLVRSPYIHEHVQLTRIVDQFSVPMGEYVFAHLLFEYQNLNRTEKAQSEKKWSPFEPELLAGKTIGIAGLGSIGTEMIRKARAFDMVVHGLSYTGKHAQLVDRHYGPKEWKEFVQELDILVLVLPLTDETSQVVDRELLLSMKPSACLVNVGRGRLIVENELIEVLRSGHLRAAILDVFEKEPLSEESPLWQLPNVRVTPHLSGINTEERICSYFLENLKRYLKNDELRGKVNRKAGY